MVFIAQRNNIVNSSVGTGKTERSGKIAKRFAEVLYFYGWSDPLISNNENAGKADDFERKRKERRGTTRKKERRGRFCFAW